MFDIYLFLGLPELVNSIILGLILVESYNTLKILLNLPFVVLKMSFS